MDTAYSYTSRKMWFGLKFILTESPIGTLRVRRGGAKHILSKNVKITACSGHFWTSRCRSAVEKVHAVVARSCSD